MPILRYPARLFLLPTLTLLATSAHAQEVNTWSDFVAETEMTRYHGDSNIEYSKPGAAETLTFSVTAKVVVLDAKGADALEPSPDGSKAPWTFDKVEVEITYGPNASQRRMRLGGVNNLLSQADFMNGTIELRDVSITAADGSLVFTGGNTSQPLLNPRQKEALVEEQKQRGHLFLPPELAYTFGGWKAPDGSEVTFRVKLTLNDRAREMILRGNRGGGPR